MRNLYSFIEEALVIIFVLAVICCGLIVSKLVIINDSVFSFILLAMLIIIVFYVSQTIRIGLKAMVDLLFKQNRAVKGIITDIIPYSRSSFSEKWCYNDHSYIKRAYSYIILVRAKGSHLTLISNEIDESFKDKILIIDYGRFSHILLNIEAVNSKKL